MKEHKATIAAEIILDNFGRPVCMFSQLSACHPLTVVGALAVIAFAGAIAFAFYGMYKDMTGKW